MDTSLALQGCSVFCQLLLASECANFRIKQMQCYANNKGSRPRCQLFFATFSLVPITTTQSLCSLCVSRKLCVHLLSFVAVLCPGEARQTEFFALLQGPS